MRPDTRKFLILGSALSLIGALFAALMLTVFGGVTHQGPHTNMGWISLIIMMGCLPLGLLSLLFALAKLITDRSRN